MNFKIVILGSTRGSNLPGLYSGLLNTNIHVFSVMSNKENAGILEKAKALKIPAVYFKSENFEKNLNDYLTENKIDLLVLMGFMKILSAHFVASWKDKIINVHPSLLPRHAGLMNLAVHQAVLDAKEKKTGCTVHAVIEKVDAGDIIIQKTCDVFLSDTAETLKARVQSLEVPALIEAIKISKKRCKPY